MIKDYNGEITRWQEFYYNIMYILEYFEIGFSMVWSCSDTAQSEMCMHIKLLDTQQSNLKYTVSFSDFLVISIYQYLGEVMGY